MSGDEPKPPTDAELAEMDRDQLVKLGTNLDGVELTNLPTPWPVPGTRAEKRAERAVALWFTISGIAGLAFVVLMAWPKWFEYRAPGTAGDVKYSLYTPLLGVTLGVAILGLGIGVLLYTKKFIPAETAVQERGDGGSKEVDKATIVAQLADSGARSTIARRSLIKRTAGLGAGALGLATVALPLAGFIKDPWKDTNNKDSLWHTGWQPQFKGEVVYMRRNLGLPAKGNGSEHDISLVKAEDLDAGAMETVFPFRESERRDEHALSLAMKRHVGCPTSLFEQRTNRILCPCHQSQFDALHYGKPIFGPATRPLAQLPITVDANGYLIARSDFNEAVGPAFWERKS